jgi:glutamate racemase
MKIIAVVLVLIVTHPGPAGLHATLHAADRLPWVRVSSDGSGFEQEGSSTPFRAMGFNYDRDASGRLIEDYWHTEWERVEDDFRNMQSLGASVVRVHLQFGRFMKAATEAREEELQTLAKLLQLAEETRLYLDLTGLGCYHKQDVPAWYDELSTRDRWKAQQAFWEAISRTCKESSAVFCYNLMNEPVIGGEKAGGDWLGPGFGGKHYVQFVARSTDGRARDEVAADWISQQVAAIRKHDTRHLVTLGFVDWSLNRPGLTSGFDPVKVAEKLDFIAVHLYPSAGKVDEALETLQGFHIGKPVIVEETFPLKCSLEEMEQFIDRSGDRSSGWMSFFWGMMPDEYRSETSIADAVTSKWLSQFSTRLKTLAPKTSVTAVKPAPSEATEPSPTVQNFVAHSVKVADGTAAHSVDLKAWSEGSRHLPIGVFDSGIGGLTVQEAILSLDAFHNDSFRPGADGRKDFEHERFIYFGDQANMPYGNYPSAQRQDFLKELILKDAAFLMGRRYWPEPNADAPRMEKPPVKAIVIACNTATAWGLEEIRAVIEAWQIPVFVVGVVEAGARGVTENLDPSRPRSAVAVLATVGTCGSNAYPLAIGRTAGLAGKVVPTVVQQGCVGLAGAIESDPAFIRDESSANANETSYLGPAGDHPVAPLDASLMNLYDFDPSGLVGDKNVVSSLRLNSVDNYIRYDVVSLVNRHQLSGSADPINTVVLGCTHFPLVRQEILDSFARLRAHEHNGMRPYESLIAEEIAIVDPAELTAKELFRELARTKLFAAPASIEPRYEDGFYMSVANARCREAQRSADGSLDRDYKYGRQPGRLDLEDTLNVPMKISLLPPASVNLIRSKLPEVWKRLSQTQ